MGGGGGYCAAKVCVVRVEMGVAVGLCAARSGLSGESGEKRLFFFV